MTTPHRQPRVPTKRDGSGDYGAKDIQVLEGLDPVRKRPGMYIGSTGLAGLHHLIWEVVDNSVDEAMAGYATRITVTLLADGGCRVDDNGRGIPVDPYPSGPHKGKSAAEVVLTVLHAGGKFGGEGYKVSGGLHGVGVSVVNALSERLIVEIDRDGHHYRQEYAKGGKPQGKMEIVGDDAGARSRHRFVGVVLARSHGLRRRGHRVRGPHRARAPADDGLPEPRPGDLLRRRAPGEGAAGHLPVQGWPGRLREAPQRRRRRRCSPRSATSRTRTRTTRRSTSPSSGTRATTRASTATPTASRPPRAACTSRASAPR